MLLWLKANFFTIIISLVLAVIVGLIIYKMVRDKRQGKSGCSCGCSNCAMQGMCHQETNKD